jgi:alkyldihydroxyacetonephosphate synthase
LRPTKVFDDLRKLLSADQLSVTAPAITTYSSDLWPRAQIWKQGGEYAKHKPTCVVWPECRQDVERVVNYCHDERVPLIPYGAGSGVCGSGTPLEGGVILDMKRMNRILKIDPKDMALEAEPGIIGLLLEEELQRKGFTLGHYPSSIACSTLGGYVATRSAGQYSSKYGKIEDMVTGLEVVTPGQGIIRTGVFGEAGAMDPWSQLLMGSEGTLGVVTKVRVRIHKAPKTMEFRGYGFKNLRSALAFMQEMMQHSRPAVLRLYDPFDSFVAGSHRETDSGEDLELLAARRADPILSRLVQLLSGELEGRGLALALRRPELLNRLSSWVPVPCLLVVGDEGTKHGVGETMVLAKRLAKAHKGKDLGAGPGLAWYKRRYAVSYKQSKIFMRGAFVDTMEVATTWDRVLPLYKGLVKTLGSKVFIMAHFSHAYPDGCSIYFTFVGHRGSHREQERLYSQVWREGLETVHRMGGTISHHHGVGASKMMMMEQEVPGGKEFFHAAKGLLDPHGILNPAKLYF